MEPVALVAVPLMRIGIVVGVAEDGIALRVHQLRVRLVGLPLGGLLPDGLTVAHGQMEAGADGRRRDVVVARRIGIAHIVERMAHLVCHGVAYGLAGRRAEPQGTDLEVVAAAIAHPFGGVVQQHHHLVVAQVGGLGIDEAQLVDFQVVESLALLQQVLLIHAVLRGRLRGFLVAVALVPEHDDIVALNGARLRPGVLVVRVALLVEQRVAGPGILPLVGDIDGFLRKGRYGNRCKQQCQEKVFLHTSTSY